MTLEEKQADLNSRVKQFNEELMQLLGKYNLGLGASATIRPDGTISAKPVIVNADDVKKEEPEPSGEKVEGELAKPEE